MKLCIFKETPTRVPSKRLHRLFEVFTEEEADLTWSGVVNLIFTTDNKIRKMNKQFRSVDKATDVLSFNIDEPSNPEATFGEVYISTATATRQAKEYGVSLSIEYLRLACHGLLHLAGYDHADPADATEMKSREEYFLGRLRGAGGHA